MNISQSTVAVPFPALSSLGSGHTSVSCPHLIPRCRHNNPSPKSDCPSKAFSSNTEIDGKPSSTSVLLGDPVNQKPIPSAESSVSNAHDQPAHSVPLPRTLQNHKSLGCSLPWLLLPLPSISETGILEPRLRDTDSAISCVITYGICSLLPPCALKLWHNLGARIAVGQPHRPFPSGTGLASPYDPTQRVGVSMCI